MKKQYHRRVILSLMFLFISGCSSTLRITRDNSGGVAISGLAICPGVRYQLTIHQDPTSNRTIEETAQSDKSIQFSGSELDIFDFSKPVDLIVIVKGTGRDDCPPDIDGKALEAKGVTPSPVQGEKKTYEVKLNAFRAKQ